MVVNRGRNNGVVTSTPRHTPGRAVFYYWKELNCRSKLQLVHNAQEQDHLETCISYIILAEDERVSSECDDIFCYFDVDWLLQTFRWGSSQVENFCVKSTETCFSCSCSLPPSQLQSAVCCRLDLHKTVSASVSSFLITVLLSETVISLLFCVWICCIPPTAM